MGFFQKHPATPTISQASSPSQPAPGGARTRYRVVGVWDTEGNLLRPRRMVVNLSEGRSTEKPGDELELTRLEAAVVGKRHALAPVFEDDDE